MRIALDRGRPLLWALLAGVLLLLFSWVDQTLTPAPGLDQSWNAALQMSAHRGDLAWGPDLAFTYGPLGFLRVPEYFYGATGAAAVLYLVLAKLAYLAAAWALARRNLGAITAAVLLLVAGYEVQEPLVALALVLVVGEITSPPAARRTDLVAVGLGALAGLEVLTKINSGIAIGAVALVGLGLFPHGGRVRRVALLAGSFLVTFLVLWLLSGQPLGDIPDYGRNAARVVSGYSAAMSIDDPALAAQYTLALLVLLVGLWGCWTSTAQLRAGRGALIAAFVLYAFFAFKAGFVRHDGGHAFLFFSAMLAAVPVLSWGGMRVPALLAAALCLVPNLTTYNQRFDDLFAPLPHAEAAFEDVGTLLDGAERDRLQRQGRAAVAGAYQIDPRLTALLQGHTVHVAPTETAIVWAYGLHWKPLPVFQSYQAYTQGLDDLNAGVVLGRQAPERILLQTGGGIDGRYGPFDSPATTRAMLCRYRPLRTIGTWMVLGLGPDRCGRARLVGSVHAAWGTTVPVPIPKERSTLVYARVAGAAPSSLSERLRTFLYKAHNRTIRFGDSTASFRLIGAVAGDGLPLVATKGADFPPPFNQAPQASAVTIDRASRPDDGAALRIDFYAVALRAP